MADKPVDFTMNRLMHEAFKREVGRLQVAVKARKDDSESDPAGLIKRWRFFSEQLVHHHESEDKFIWPVVRERATDPADIVIIDAMESEHSALDNQLELLDGQFDAMSAGENVDLTKVGRQLDDLKVIVSGHCAHEERDGMRVAQEYVKSEDLKEFHKFTRSGPDSSLVFPWVCDGAPASDQQAAWGVLPGFVRVIARPIMNRKYLSARAEFS
jgi:hemerythrin-like domain-containing protein